MERPLTPAPLVSVIIPVHNEVKWLREAVTSVLRQDYSRIELILVDDRSTDGSAEEAKRLADEFPEVVAVSSIRPPGAAGARNCGLELAKGDIITYLDGDDLMAPGRLRAFVSYLLANPSCDVVLGLDELLLQPGVHLPSPLKHRSNGHLAPYTMSAAHKASLLQVVGGFDESFYVAEDGDWIARAKASGCRVDLTDTVATIRRIHGANISYQHHQSPMRSLALVAMRERAGLGHRVSLLTGTAPKR